MWRICDTMRIARLFSADNIKILVSGYMYKIHAANMPTTVDLPECRNAINNPRCGSVSHIDTKNSIMRR